MIDQASIDLSRPEITVGFAMVDQDNRPFPITVAATERGALVNALVFVFECPVYAHNTDAFILSEFRRRAGTKYHIATVTIEAVDVVTDEAAT